MSATCRRQVTLSFLLHRKLSPMVPLLKFRPKQIISSQLKLHLIYLQLLSFFLFESLLGSLSLIPFFNLSILPLFFSVCSIYHWCFILFLIYFHFIYSLFSFSWLLLYLAQLFTFDLLFEYLPYYLFWTLFPSVWLFVFSKIVSCSTDSLVLLSLFILVSFRRSSSWLIIRVALSNQYLIISPLLLR